jgi:hypothetical protein
VQRIDMSDAADAVAALGVPADVLSRVCEAMTLVADGDAKVAGAQLLRIAVDEDVGAVAAMALRRKVSIAAPVPARSVCGVAALMLLRWCMTVCRGLRCRRLPLFLLPHPRPRPRR